MKKDNILGIVVMGCGLLLALSVFLPYVSYYSTSLSLWKMDDASRFIYILLGLFVIVLYLVNKKTEMSYLAAGYGAFTSIANIISIEGFDGLSIGFYLILLSSIAIGIITFLYDESKADALINLSVSVNKPVAPQPVYNQPMNNQQPVSHSVNQISAQPISQPVAPVTPQVQEQPKPLRFDPMTGQPIYSDQNNN